MRLTIRPPFTHVLAGSRIVRRHGCGKVDTDGSAVQDDTVELVDTPLGIVDGAHGDETETSGSVALLQVQLCPTVQS